MSAPPFMPLWVGDYLADTTHLSRQEHGAYLLLLMAMWRAGGRLPNDDTRLARLAKCSPEEWQTNRAVILEFFQVTREHITHRRMVSEIARYAGTVERRSKAGKKGAEKRWSNNNEVGMANAIATPCDGHGDANATAMAKNSEPEPEPEPSIPSEANASSVGAAPPVATPRQPELTLVSGERDGPADGADEEKAKAAELATRRAEAKRMLVELADAIWIAQPKLGERRRATKPDVQRALIAAVKRGGRPQDIRRACLAYYALPASREANGKFAMGAARLLENDRWKDFLPAEPAAARSAISWAGPPEFLAEAVAAKSEGWAGSYLGACRWTPGDPPSLIAQTAYIADRIRSEIPLIIRKYGVRVVHAAAA